VLYVVFPSVVLWMAFMARYEQLWINEHVPTSDEQNDSHEA
jgi:hypothetical protein